MLNYKLRKATNNDFQLAYDIRKNALGEYVKQTWGWDEEWQMKYHTEDFDTNILRIIEVNDSPVGSLEKSTEKDNITVSGLYIIDEFQGKGIGGDIMKNIIAEADENNRAVRFQVLKVNEKAKRFYERLGFSVCGETETHHQMIYNPIGN